MNLSSIPDLFATPIDLLSSKDGMSTRHAMAICHSTMFMEMIQDGMVEIYTPMKGAREEVQRLRLTTMGQKWYNGYLQGQLKHLQDENARLLAEQEELEKQAPKPAGLAFKKLEIGRVFKLDERAYRKLNDSEDWNAELLADVEHRMCSMPEDTVVLPVISES